MTSDLQKASEQQRCLIIHAGGNKTGSTAIQNMLDLNSNAIAQHGIDYISITKNAYSERPQNGNGVQIAKGLLQGTSSYELKSRIRDVLGRNRVSIVSSEDFCLLRKRHLESFAACLSEMNIRTEILMFVREPVEYFRSNYSQRLRMGQALTFQSYLHNPPVWQHAEFLKAAASCWPREFIHVLSYDNGKSSLFFTFWEKIRSICGVDITEIFEPVSVPVNRSFYLEELNLLRNLNQLFGIEFSQAISEWFTYASDYVGTAWEVGQPSINRIYDLHQADVDWINTTFFGGQNVVRKPAGPPEINDVQSAPDRLPDSNTLMKLLFFVLRNASQVTELGLTRFLINLADISEKYGGTSKLGDGTQFDNYYYLIKNPDLVHAGANPCLHFETYGRAEGRNWRSCDCDNCKALAGG